MSVPQPQPKAKSIPIERVVTAIERIRAGARYGSVVVKIHDGCITEMDKTEKERPE